MDKIVLKFMADLMYVHGMMCYEEYADILESKNFSDLDNIIEKVMREEYNVYKRGEGYIRYAK